MTDPGKTAPVFRFGLADRLGTAFTTGLFWPYWSARRAPQRRC
ncbi:MAG: hypothetical protein WEA77_14545 [Hyphomonas sp.]